MTTYGLRADTIVGYTFKAETLCPSCTLEAVKVDLGVSHPDSSALFDKFLRVLSWNVEDVLDFFAPKNDPVIDRQDEHSFDSDDFPKVIFSSDLDDEPCDHCANMLIGDR